MRCHLAIAALLLTPLAVSPANAQIFSAYGTFATAKTSNVQTGLLTTSSGYQQEYTSFSSRGFGGGITLGVLPIGPIRIGLDLRGSSKPGNNGADLALAGLKVGLKVPILTLKPYVQGSVGYLGTRTTDISTVGGGGSHTNQYLAYEFFGGIDLPIIHFLDFRLIEIGGGQGIFVFGGSSASNATILTVTTGAVFHF